MTIIVNSLQNLPSSKRGDVLTYTCAQHLGVVLRELIAVQICLSYNEMTTVSLGLMLGDDHETVLLFLNTFLSVVLGIAHLEVGLVNYVVLDLILS